jgi:DNA repair photolyase
MNEVLNQATKKIANIIQKSMSRQKVGTKGAISTENLDSLIRD